MRGDVHIHSKYSPDSRLEIDQIIKTAKKRNLDFIAISDHNKFIEHKGDLLVIGAEEVTSIDGHILALFVDGEIPSKLSQEETVDIIHDRNGIAICAHPFRTVNGIGAKFKNIYDAIESKNGRCRTKCNLEGQKMAERLRRPITAGSDSHFYDEIGRVFMEVDASDGESIRKAILNSQVKTGGVDLTSYGQVRLYLKLSKDYTKRGFKRI
ncbi:MAG: PHP domain-containing protein [Candidatus Thermoplasmatota archaeon]|jgi:predicted metal-dependent phosphoesterase TrpH|nr:PHP domain-containing protein [Candidatus Thermoplasmatota archaeon]